MVNGEAGGCALSMLVYREQCIRKGEAVCKKLRDEIPRHQFKIRDPGVPSGTSIIARETVSALRKDVTAKCYGGDISRKTETLRKAEGGKKNG